jgi:F420-dependent oxidoreductase-like protein
VERTTGLEATSARTVEDSALPWRTRGLDSLRRMRIGIFGGEVVGDGGIDEVVKSARRAADEGFASYWMPQIFGLDALTSLAVVGREAPGIELGTAVVPTYPRHPMMLAGQALTTQAIIGGRLILGIGLSHQLVIEGMFGQSFEKPVRHMQEYLSILMPLVHEGTVSFRGETLSANGTLNIAGASPCPVLIAALGPKMLELAGSVADGTITWMTGPGTLESHTVPAITKAAEQAGRPPPRVCVGLPVCVTDDPDGARERAGRVFAVYDSLPSYKAMLDREGAAGPADVAIVGDEATVASALRRLADVGTTDFSAVEYGSASKGDRERTRELLRSLL